MRTLIRTTNDDGSCFELDVEGAVSCSVQIRPVATARAAIAHAPQPDAAAIAEAEAIFAHLLPGENLTDEQE